MHHISDRLLFMLSVSVAFCAFAPSARAVSVDLTSGTTGSLLFNQSFNGETRSADVTLLGADDQQVLSMTVTGVDIRNSSAPVGARIYSSAGMTIATADELVPVGENQTITIPISGTLIAGSSYRLAFFVPSRPNGNNGDLFDPAPPGAGGFGYVESQGLFQVNGGFQIGGDSFPTTASGSAIPRIGLELVPEPSSAILLGLGWAGLWLRNRGRRPIVLP
jgi:hypothetical protein